MVKYFLVLVLFLCIYPINSQENELKIALVDIPMITMEKEKEGFGYGLISDILKSSCEKAEIKYSPVFLPLKRAKILFIQQEIPFIFGNPNRYATTLTDKDINYIPFYKTRKSFFYYKPNWIGNDNYENYSDLKKYKLGVPRGYFLIPTYINYGIKIELYNSAANATKMLMSGRIDLLENIDFQQFYIINTLYSKSSSDFDFLRKESLYSIDGITYYSDNRKSKEIARKFKNGLNIILQNGEYIKIIERYYQPEKIPQYQIDFYNKLLE